MRELSIEEVKAIQLNILKEVADFCDNNELTYFLCGGTLLGAVRHKGFIPWDDDIDIMMPRPDYERLVKLFKIKNLQLCEYRITKDYDKTFANVADTKTLLEENVDTHFQSGVNIDILPIDGFPDNDAEIHQHIAQINRYRRIMGAKQIRYRKGRAFYKNAILMLAKPVTKVVTLKKLIHKITKCAKKYSFAESSKAGIAVWGYGIREVCPQRTFIEQIEIEFEGIHFKAPKDYHTYLSTVYGDYMKLPPKEKQVSHHDYKAFAL